LWLLLLAPLAAVGIAALQMLDPINDRAFANIFSYVIAFVTFMAFLVWFVLFSGFPGLVRWCTPAVLIGAFGAVALNISGCSGNMLPIFGRSELVAMPEVVGGKVDLTSTTADDFPQFLGPKRNQVIEGIKLARDWEKNPPKELWRQQIGAGWSGFAVVNGYAVTLEQRGGKELVTCYEVKTGKPQWAWSHDARYETFLGGVGPRSTPTIHEGKVYALGATGRLVCLDGTNGKLLWDVDLLKEFGISSQEETSELNFGRSNSPLVVDDLVVVPVGGASPQRVSLAALDKNTGKLVWKNGNRNASYSSPALAELAGVRQILIVNEDTVSGHDPKTGKVLWEFDWPGNSSQDANSSQAVPLPPDRVFVSKGYGRGAALYQLAPGTDGALTPNKLWHNRRVLRTKFTNVAMQGGHVYGLSDGILECVKLESGESVWKDGRYGHGQILLAGDLLLVLGEDGGLHLVEATPEKSNHVLGSVQAVQGTTWNNLALYGKYVLVRNAREAVCYELALSE
jgi:outer membrane protein assembly factor BamB